MQYSVCLIDDAFPTGETLFDDSTLLDGNVLKFLSEKAQGWDLNLKALCDSLRGDSARWSIGGFKHPKLYLQYFKKSQYHPDFIVYDWEYSSMGAGDTPEDFLLEILKSSFSVVYVYTGRDSEHRVSGILAGDDFKEYKDKRLFILSKTAENSADTLQRKAEALASDNFSFRFGAEIRTNALRALEKILLRLGSVTSGDVSKFISPGEGTSNLVDFLAERFRNEILSLNFNPAPTTASTTNTDSVVEQLWTYRLYFTPGDDLVRRGDVTLDANGKHCIVVTGDCDLACFWDNKTHGHINYVPLIKLEAGAWPAFKEHFSIPGDRTAAFYRGKLWFSSIANFPPNPKHEIKSGAFILPFVRVNADSFNYIGYSKSFNSDIIPLPATHGNPLKYSEWSGHRRICTLSEPFLTPLINNIIHSLSGTGAPDYEYPYGEVQKAILKRSDKLS